MEQEPGKMRPGWVRHTGMGVELVAAVVGFCLLGIWIDHKYDTEPNGTLICALIGLVGGMFNFIRQAIRATKDQQSAPEPDEDERS